MEKIALYKGRTLDDMSKEELIEAINEICSYYKSRMNQQKSDYEFLLDLKERKD